MDALIVTPRNTPHAGFHGTHAIRPAVGMMVQDDQLLERTNARYFHRLRRN
jgi:hypothetical protein